MWLIVTQPLLNWGEVYKKKEVKKDVKEDELSAIVATGKKKKTHPL